MIYHTKNYKSNVTIKNVNIYNKYIWIFMQYHFKNTYHWKIMAVKDIQKYEILSSLKSLQNSSEVKNGH